MFQQFRKPDAMNIDSHGNDKISSFVNTKQAERLKSRERSPDVDRLNGR